MMIKKETVNPELYHVLYLNLQNLIKGTASKKMISTTKSFSSR